MALGQLRGRQISVLHSVGAVSALCCVMALVGCTGHQPTTRTSSDGVSPSLLRSLSRESVDPIIERRPLGSEDVLRIAVVSDLNGSYGSTSYGPHVHAAVDRLVAMEPDIVITAGDMVAGQRQGLDYDAMWSAFHEAVSDPLAAARIPFAISPGNHDASGYDGFEGERERYSAAWDGRKPDLDYVDDTHFPFRYAYKVRGVLFVALDITTAERMDKEQRAWLDAVLTENADAEQKIVYGHVPIYPFAEGQTTGITNDVRLEEMLNRHHVTMFVSGHHQAYYPGHRGELRMVGTGCLGGGVRKLLGTDEPSVRTIVLIEIDKYGVRRVEGIAGSNFDTVVDRHDLPEALGTEAQRIVRDDLGEPQYIARRLEKMEADGIALASLTSMGSPTTPPVFVAGVEPPPGLLAASTPSLTDSAAGYAGLMHPHAPSPGDIEHWEYAPTAFVPQLPPGLELHELAWADPALALGAPLRMVRAETGSGSDEQASLPPSVRTLVMP